MNMDNYGGAAAMDREMAAREERMLEMACADCIHSRVYNDEVAWCKVADDFVDPHDTVRDTGCEAFS